MSEPYEDPRITRTRKMIVNAFLTLVQEKEFNAISVKDITEHAMINRATFYRHFADKYALLDAIFLELMAHKGIEKIKEQTELNRKTFLLLLDTFEQLIGKFKKTFDRNYEAILQLTENQMKKQLIELIRTLKPLDTKDPDQIISTMLVMSIHGATCNWIGSGHAISREEFLQTTIPFLAGSIDHLVHDQ